MRKAFSCNSPLIMWVVVLLTGQQSRPVPPMLSFHLVKTRRGQTSLQSLSTPSVFRTRATALGSLCRKVPQEQSHPALFFLYFFIESFIKENRSLNLTSTDLQKAPGVGKWQLFRIVVQMENIKKKKKIIAVQIFQRHSETSAHRCPYK